MSIQQGEGRRKGSRTVTYRETLRVWLKSSRAECRLTIQLKEERVVQEELHVYSDCVKIVYVVGSSDNLCLLKWKSILLHSVTLAFCRASFLPSWVVSTAFPGILLLCSIIRAKKSDVADELFLGLTLLFEVGRVLHIALAFVQKIVVPIYELSVNLIYRLLT